MKKRKVVMYPKQTPNTSSWNYRSAHQASPCFPNSCTEAIDRRKPSDWQPFGRGSQLSSRAAANNVGLPASWYYVKTQRFVLVFTSQEMSKI